MAGRYVPEGAIYSDATGDLPPRKSEKTRVKETLEKITQLKTRFLLTPIKLELGGAHLTGFVAAMGLRAFICIWQACDLIHSHFCSYGSKIQLFSP